MHYQIGKKDFSKRIVIDVPTTSGMFIDFYLSKQKQLLDDYEQLSKILNRADKITEPAFEPLSSASLYRTDISLEKCLKQFIETDPFKVRWSTTAYAINSASCIPSIDAVFTPFMSVSDVQNGVIFLKAVEPYYIAGSQPAFERNKKPVVFDFHNPEDFDRANQALKKIEKISMQSSTISRFDFFKVFLSTISQMGFAPLPPKEIQGEKA